MDMVNAQSPEMHQNVCFHLLVFVVCPPFFWFQEKKVLLYGKEFTTQDKNMFSKHEFICFV